MRSASRLARGSGEGDGKIKGAGATARLRPCLHIEDGGASTPECGAGRRGKRLGRNATSWRRLTASSLYVTSGHGAGSTP